MFTFKASSLVGLTQFFILSLALCSVTSEQDNDKDNALENLNTNQTVVSATNQTQEMLNKLPSNSTVMQQQQQPTIMPMGRRPPYFADGGPRPPVWLQTKQRNFEPYRRPPHMHPPHEYEHSYAQPYYPPPLPPPHHHHHRHHYQHQLRGPAYYRSFVQTEPIRVEHVGHMINQFMSGVSKMFHNVFGKPDRFHQAHHVPSSRLFTGESSSQSNWFTTSPKPLIQDHKPSASNLETRYSNDSVDNAIFRNIPEEQINTTKSVDYDLQGQKLREDIARKMSQLQTVITTAIEVSKERRDIITRRILEQTNYRLEQAKERADRILSEPMNSQLAVRALNTVNQGLNGMHTFLHGLMERIKVSINVNIADPGQKNQSVEGKPSSNNTTTESQQ